MGCLHSTMQPTIVDYVKLNLKKESLLKIGEAFANGDSLAFGKSFQTINSVLDKKKTFI